MLGRANHVLIADVILHRTGKRLGHRQIRALFPVRRDFRLDDDRTVKVDEAPEHIGAADRVKSFAATHADAIKRDAVGNRFGATSKMLIGVHKIVEHLVVRQRDIDFLAPLDIRGSAWRLAADARKQIRRDRHVAGPGEPPGYFHAVLGNAGILMNHDDSWPRSSPRRRCQIGANRRAPAGILNPRRFYFRNFRHPCPPKNWTISICQVAVVIELSQASPGDAGFIEFATASPYDRRGWRRISWTPFDSSTPRSATVIKAYGRRT